MTGPGSDLDAARRAVVEGDLVPEAVGQLTPVLSGVSLEVLGPVKQLLKRFFSDQPWTEADDDALATAVGAGEGRGRHLLAPGLALVWAWEDGRFRVRVEREHTGSASPPSRADAADATAGLAQTFEGGVVPEATPSPRTIRFATPDLHEGPSRSYTSAAEAAADTRVARLFAEFDDVTSVLVGPDFVAVSVSRPNLWEALLAPVLAAITEEFTGAPADRAAETGAEAPVTRSLGVGPGSADARPPRQLEQAWVELGALRGDRPEHVERVLAAAGSHEPARRQVAAALLADAPAPVAGRAWARLLDDPSRAVRRSVVDTIVDSGRDDLRPLLEHALDDSDAWTRWKALRGIATLGIGPSRAAVEARAQDPDFRVRLEATRALTATDS